MRTRTQQWWLTGGLVLALLSGGAALRSGYGIGGKTIAGFGISGKPIAQSMTCDPPCGDQPPPHRLGSSLNLAGYGIGGLKIRDGYALGG